MNAHTNILIAILIAIISLFIIKMANNTKNTDEKALTIEDLMLKSAADKSGSGEINFNNHRFQFVLFGDSITQRGSASNGWGTLLGDKYTRRADIVNRGYSGYNTEFCKLLLEKQLANKIWPFNPNQRSNTNTYERLVTIFLGANDSVLKAFPQHVSIENYEANLLKIVSLLIPRKLETPATTDKYGVNTVLSECGTGLILITPPQIDPPRYAKFFGDIVVDEYSREYENTLKYVNVVKSIGARYNIPVVDLWTLTPISTDPNLDCFNDGLHLNTRGNVVLFEAVLSTIKQFYPMLKDTVLPLDGPLWDRVDRNDIPKSFT
jgi:lysophospholipase L1-like esterase